MANINEKGIAENASDINIALEKMTETVHKLVFEPTTGEHRRIVGIPYYVRLEMRGKRKAYAWVSKDMVWWSKKGQFAYELCVATESMSRPAEELFLTLVHELVHLANQTDGIKDCADSSDRHNKLFKEACDDVGIACEDLGDKRGYATAHKITDCSVALQKAFKQYLEECKEELKLFNVCGGYDPSEMAINSMGQADGGNFLKAVEKAKAEREAAKAKKKKGNNAIKYQCPGCKASFRATSLLRVMCIPCNCEFIAQIKDNQTGEELPKAADK